LPVDLVWTAQAREDLIEIYTYIGLENSSAAERIFDAVQVNSLRRGKWFRVPTFAKEKIARVGSAIAVVYENTGVLKKVDL
jgi:hypothetical protein